MDNKYFNIISQEEIKKGKASDIYFFRTQEILKEKGLYETEVNAEVTISSLPSDYNWGVFAGLRDTIKLLEGLPIDVYALPEGTIIPERDEKGVKVPALVIRGEYGPFATYETPMLGFLSSASGVASKAARIRKVAGKEVPLIYFGARRSHPSLISFNGLYAYIGGFNNVSCPLAAKRIGKEPSGTMPHALLIIFRGKKGSHAKAWKAFHEVMPEKVPRICLTDTFFDEVEESLKAVETIGKDNIWGVRLDTPSTRRGSFESIISEVRWKLNSHGFEDVKIFCSGGVDEKSVEKLSKAGAEGFGIGGAVADAPIIDYANDITAVKEGGTWNPLAKRGRFDGLKQVLRHTENEKYRYKVLLEEPDAEIEERETLLRKYIEDGEIIREPPAPKETRKYILDQLDNVDEVER